MRKYHRKASRNVFSDTDLALHSIRECHREAVEPLNYSYSELRQLKDYKVDPILETMISDWQLRRQGLLDRGD